ncbi:Trimethyllysine dioxygenase [Polychytrium aggregatum]|uniref:Trimethyllysine dioxygenase n=1 Tax=Polychytrium aggregatum TaxID=110093 RepID=UPI0022FE25AD|nr:Trimethyllysine dioxygenase [Polychytrium aggregatum]KAI9193713.1 Trimethyllysine dioxygenase [Polychytrium aggregatum]
MLRVVQKPQRLCQLGRLVRMPALQTAVLGNAKAVPAGSQRPAIPLQARAAIVRAFGTSAHLEAPQRHSAVVSSDTKSQVTVAYPDGKSTSFHGIWLRDHCRCPQCFHPITKQRLSDTGEFPLDIKPQSIEIVGDKDLRIVWPSTQHESVFSLEWLRQHSYWPNIGTARPAIREKILWNAETANTFPRVSYESIMAGDQGLAEWLRNIDVYGIGFVEGVPPNAEDTETLAKRIGIIRETHYGGFWDFTSDLSHGDTAYTTIGLPAHTDTTYFTDPIGLQTFHLLAHEGTGGESIYVDSFYAAKLLKEQHPEHYETLSTVPVRTHCAGDEDELHFSTPSHRPIFGLDPITDELIQVRFNEPDRSILNHIPGDKVYKFYEALAVWRSILTHPESEFKIALRPGTVVAVDNWRVLHGRTAFTGYRRLVGCYHGWDELQSRIRVVLDKSQLKETV